MKHPFRDDDHASCSPAVAGRAAMAVINSVQQVPPAVQAHGIAAAFILLAERYGLEPQHLFQRTTNLMNYAEGRRPEFAAVAEYLANEL